MKQIFLLGASSVYGVGGSNGGWSTLLKNYYHEKMYSDNGEGETTEVFNFAKSGATTQFVIDTLPDQIKFYGRGDKVTLIISVGGNDSKATGTPNNFVSTVDQYVSKMKELLGLCKTYADTIIIVSNSYVDESKTNPKISPFDGSKSYFTNERRELFRISLKKLCKEENVSLLHLNTDQDTWLTKYLYKDGLHPNAEGHSLFFNALIECLESTNS